MPLMIEDQGGEGTRPVILCDVCGSRLAVFAGMAESVTDPDEPRAGLLRWQPSAIAPAFASPVFVCKGACDEEMSRRHEGKGAWEELSTSLMELAEGLGYRAEQLEDWSLTLQSPLVQYRQ